MKKIAIYGGSFNPIGKHHMMIANQLFKYMDEVWITPCYKSITGKSMEDDNHRMNMCLKAIDSNSDNRIKLCDFEIKNKLYEESYNILSKVLDHYFDGTYTKKFYFVIGSDNALTINTWENWDKLIKMMPFVVIPRPDYGIPTDHWCMDSYSHIYFADIKPLEGSSTQIRKDLQNNKNTDLVDPNVMEYILDNGLYGCI